MTLLRRRSLLPAVTAQTSWMGYAPEDDSTVIELVYEYGREKIERGEGYGQVAVSTPDVYKAAEAVEKTKYEVSHLGPGDSPRPKKRLVCPRPHALAASRSAGGDDLVVRRWIAFEVLGTVRA